ncbi:hypothetical protein RB595_000927 [Gaeumannomyces hyphopodioides]
MMASTRSAGSGRPHPEMLQKPHLHETFFSLKNAGPQQRPLSVATEFMESDFDDDEILSDVDDGETSPRISLNSSGQPSFTTLSSYEEAQTPRSFRARTAFQVEADSLRQVEGPRGPHLFRSSSLSAHSAEFEHALSLSPITPKVPPQGTEYHLPVALELTPLPNKRRGSGPRFTDAELDTCDLADWSPEMVAQQMLNAGVEQQTAERFVENDITGAILMTLKFRDLSELGITSFGMRTKVWNEILNMLDVQVPSERPETVIEDEPDREVRREQRAMDMVEEKPKRKQSRRKQKHLGDDIISPLESVSIVGIEQMMPKPHHCKKGENCSKWKRNQRMIEAFKNDHPFVDMDKGGVIMVAGDPGNPLTAEALNRKESDVFRPVSDAIPSVVASSDIMGPGGIPPLQYLQEAALRNIQAQDPQDNVRQFLSFQHQAAATAAGSSEVPPTPPFELYPQMQPHHAQEAMRSLPRLAIPSHQMRSMSQTPASAVTVMQHRSRERTSPRHSSGPSPEATPTAPYRFGTPFSDMDVPVTAIPLGPVARDVSQSVPPDMNYRAAPSGHMRSASRSSRRPSFPVLPALDENRVAVVSPQRPSRTSSPLSGGGSPVAGAQHQQHNKRPLQAPPRVQYPWTKERVVYEKAIAPPPGKSGGMVGPSLIAASGSPHGVVGVSHDAEGITYQGPMRKRKTRMLRHEWHEHYFTLKGTRLAMHKDANEIGRTLEYVDIDDYAVACSSLAGTSKLNAAFRAMSIRRGSENDAGAFSFQLIPQDARGGVKLLRKRESLNPSAGAGNASSDGEGTNGTGKTHYFAVKGRDERIDWMRELMLAKALKQKGEGFEVSVNGNMI